MGSTGVVPGGRWRWLGHPAFIVAVGVLALNDHVLKARYPGWWTGKLSDVAGVAVVATIAAVVLGPRRGLVLVGCAFAALKTVPLVNELAGPVLGGTTRRDATDLVALAVLVPLWFVLERADGRRSFVGAQMVTSRADVIRRVRHGLAAAAPLVGLAVAVVSVTATSCTPGPAVDHVTARDGVLFTHVDGGSFEGGSARSTDGGATWEVTDPPAGVTVGTWPAYSDPGATGAQEACADDGSCWRLRDRRAIDRKPRGGAWTEEIQVSAADLAAISTGCRGHNLGVLSSIAAIGRDGDAHVVASFGAHGALVREDDGSWTPTAVLEVASPVRVTTSDRVAVAAAFVFGPLLGLVLWLARRVLPSWHWALVVAATGWLGAFLVAVLFASGVSVSENSALRSGRAVTAVMVLTTVMALVVARLPARPTAGMPPAPPPRPPPPPPW